MYRFYELVNYAYDPLHFYWSDRRIKRALADMLIAAFLLGIVAIELNRQGLLPAWLGGFVPVKHYYAIKLAFTLVLLIELVDLVFVLPCSVSKSVGKQFEILALILLRNAFKGLTNFQEPIEIADPVIQVLPIISDGLGAMLLFAGLGIYYAMQPKSAKDADGEVLFRYVAAKKAVSLVLLAVFAATGLWMFYESMFHRARVEEYFEVVYTVLIFSDILLVLIAQRHQPHFRAIFRNSSFALTTLLIRLALAAPRYYDVAISLTAVVLAIGITAAHNRFGKHMRS